ncbi:MAG: hypothetical protein IKB61_00075 [Elusimicrobiaceae bacterium]|nr:hypothetical protein [Elusimicrobiaceae bacterium]
MAFEPCTFTKKENVNKASRAGSEKALYIKEKQARKRRRRAVDTIIDMTTTNKGKSRIPCKQCIHKKQSNKPFKPPYIRFPGGLLGDR